MRLIINSSRNGSIIYKYSQKDMGPKIVVGGAAGEISGGGVVFITRGGGGVVAVELPTVDGVPRGERSGMDFPPVWGGGRACNLGF